MSASNSTSLLMALVSGETAGRLPNTPESGVAGRSTALVGGAASTGLPQANATLGSSEIKSFGDCLRLCELPTNANSPASNSARQQAGLSLQTQDSGQNAGGARCLALFEQGQPVATVDSPASNSVEHQARPMALPTSSGGSDNEACRSALFEAGRTTGWMPVAAAETPSTQTPVNGPTRRGGKREGSESQPLSPSGDASVATIPALVIADSAADLVGPVPTAAPTPGEAVSSLEPVSAAQLPPKATALIPMGPTSQGHATPTDLLRSEDRPSLSEGYPQAEENPLEGATQQSPQAEKSPVEVGILRNAPVSPDSGNGVERQAMPAAQGFDQADVNSALPAQGVSEPRVDASNTVVPPVSPNDAKRQAIAATLAGTQDGSRLSEGHPQAGKNPLDGATFGNNLASPVSGNSAERQAVAATLAAAQDGSRLSEDLPQAEKWQVEGATRSATQGTTGRTQTASSAAVSGVERQSMPSTQVVEAASVLAAGRTPAQREPADRRILAGVEEMLLAAGRSASGDAPSGVDEGLSQDVNATSRSGNPLSAQLADAFGLPVRASAQQISIRLDPPELGTVRLKLRSIGGQVSGVLRVDNPSTLEEIRRALPGMIERLADSGVQVRSLEVVSGGGDGLSQGGRQEQPGSWAGDRPARWEREEPPEAPAASNAGAPRPKASAAAGSGAINVWI